MWRVGKIARWQEADAQVGQRCVRVGGKEIAILDAAQDACTGYIARGGDHYGLF